MFQFAESITCMNYREFIIYLIFVQAYKGVMNVCWRNTCKFYTHLPRRWNSSQFQQPVSPKPTLSQILAKKISRIQLARQLERKPVLHSKMRRESFFFKICFLVSGGYALYSLRALAEYVQTKMAQ